MVENKELKIKSKLLDVKISDLDDFDFKANKSGNIIIENAFDIDIYKARDVRIGESVETDIWKARDVNISETNQLQIHDARNVEITEVGRANISAKSIEIGDGGQLTLYADSIIVKDGYNTNANGRTLSIEKTDYLNVGSADYVWIGEIKKDQDAGIFNAAYVTVEKAKNLYLSNIGTLNSPTNNPSTIDFLTVYSVNRFKGNWINVRDYKIDKITGDNVIVAPELLNVMDASKTLFDLAKGAKKLKYKIQ